MRIFIILLFISLQTKAFEEVQITPENSKGWNEANVREDAMIEINKNRPLFGDGSLMFATDSLTPGQDKADYELTWFDSLSRSRTLGSLSRLSYSWFRDSKSTTNSSLIPVLRLYFYDDNNTPLIRFDDVTGLLIWEGVYNNYTNPIVDSWENVDIVNDNFWVFVTSNKKGDGVGVIQNYNSSLNDWISNTPVGQPGDPSISLSASTQIVGINLGVGSGWGNIFLGYVDAVRIAFGPQDDYLYNFEACSLLVTHEDSDILFSNSFECIKIF